VSDDLEILDPTELDQQGRNYYDELAYSMRQRIINFIRAAPEQSEKQWKRLEAFIASAPDTTVREIHARMMSVAGAAEVLMWKNKLQAYIEGNPSPPKYEADRGTRNPLQFLEAVWGEFLDHGVLYQDTLSSYDSKLIPSIYNYWNSHSRLDGDRLPLPKRDRTEAILQRVVAHGPDAFEDVMRAVRAYARRGEREK
jgi:hypothetical protein